MKSDRIEHTLNICNGKPVIKGTQITVSTILEQIAKGKPWDDILRSYPELNAEDIPASLSYAIAAIDHSEVKAVDV